MMGPRQEAQAALFYEFSLEDHVPHNHLVRSIDRFVDLTSVRVHLADFYSHTGRPSIDPELLIRMLLIGYCFGIRSERRLCEEVHLNLAYRWFCRLDLTDRIPDHSSFSKNRHGRFRESDLLRHVFETTVARCMKEGLVGGQGFAVDASRSNKTAEVGAMRKMLDRTEERFGVKPDWIAADTAYGSSDTLVWLALKRQIVPFIPVFDKGERTDGIFSRSDFTWDDENDRYICPGGKEMRHTWRTYSDPKRNAPVWKSRNYRALKSDCTGCELKAKCCPNAETRSVHRDKYEIVRDFARQCTTSDFNPKAQARRKKVEMLFAHLKRILGLGRLRLRGPCGVQDEFTLAAIAQNLRKLAKLKPILPAAG
jgi:transposase